MHEPVFTHLEEYLSGTLAGPEREAVEQHLAKCAPCRTETEKLRELSGLFGVMRPEKQWEASAGFYAGVMSRVEAQAAGSFWNFFLDVRFARPLAYASVALVALVGTYLMNQPRGTEDILQALQVPPPVVGTSVAEPMTDAGPVPSAQSVAFEAVDPDADAILASLAIADE